MLHATKYINVMSLKTGDYSKHTNKKFLSKNFLEFTKNNRVRKPVKPTRGRVVGCHPSLKSKEPVEWESQMELKTVDYFNYVHLPRNQFRLSILSSIDFFFSIQASISVVVAREQSVVRQYSVKESSRILDVN
ncbi:hypothetical protein [Thalassotalea marina]|uniref:Uncharacterized protein n=1 Tax=Thalassotalea marina TaxID=1673741 RepID=A0A919BRM7_9GAMM|nr:hypothetical protein [Thalassotalea marina]GHG06977.1 hypothetical protein GCM10017161_40740 [Thalassotalea marina]